MEIPSPTLPHSLESAHDIIMGQHREIASQEAEIVATNNKVVAYQKRIDLLEEMLRLERARRYGRAADQYVDPNAPQQASLFDEEMLEDCGATEPDDTDDDASDEVEVKPHTRKSTRGKRQPLPSYLERVRVEHTLPEAELMGEEGEIFEKIGEEISEQLDVVPATVRVIQNVRFKYAVKGKEELGVKIAPMPQQIINKGIATPGLLAHVAQAKYCYHLPLYRQEKIWLSLDVHLPRNTLCRWMLKLGEALTPLIEYQLEDMKQHRHIHVDETPVTILAPKTPLSEKKTHKGFMWVYANHLGIVYDYQSSRHGSHPQALLEDFEGYVQTDSYAGYACLFTDGRRKSVGCMAHARRKFIDIQKAAPKPRKGKKKKPSVSSTAIDLIAKLYKLESEAKAQALDEAATYQLRQEKARPILDKLYAFLISKRGTAPPTGLLHKAISYTLNHWDALARYIEDGTINIDNNPAERAIKPFVIGRKNWLFCGNTRGAKASANLFSLIESAKLYNLKVFDYLKYVFEQLPKATKPRQLEQLLPAYAQEHCPKIKPKN